MVGSKLELDILNLFRKNIAGLYSINQIAKLLGKKYPYVNKVATDLINEKVLNKIVVGKSYLCSLNLANPKTLNQLALLEQGDVLAYQNITSFLDKRKHSISIECAVKKDNKLIFVIHNLKERRELESGFPGCIVLDEQEFISMLLEDKDLYEKRAVVYGFERFYELIRADASLFHGAYSPLRYKQ
jgi:hypothetical protein